MSGRFIAEGSGDGEIPFTLLASAGKVPGVTPLFKFGVNPDVDTASIETVWANGGGDGDAWQITKEIGKDIADIGDVLSSIAGSEAGIAAGTGARTMTLYGLDSNYNEIQETVTLNGTSNVTSVKSYLRISRCIVNTSGSSNYNEGTITVTVDSATVAIVTPTEGQTLQAIYTVPADSTLMLYQFYVSMQKKTSALMTFHLEVRPFGGSWNVKQVLGIDSTGASSFQRFSTVPFPIPEKTDIRVRVHDSSSTDIQVSAAFDGLLIDNNVFNY